jgi:predicted DCC family thiol-disulfide oxidoreductase YuxK
MNPREPILLFDGECNFCNGAVHFIIRHERGTSFHFASLQSEAGRALLREHDLRDLPLSTVVLIDEGKAYLGSAAALRTARRLGGFFSLLFPLVFIPRPLRDFAYYSFARNRYRLFGRATHCQVPTPELRARFLDQV